MDCKEGQRLIDGYVDGELDLVRNLGIEDHLHGCAVCSGSYQERRALRDGIRAHGERNAQHQDKQRREECGGGRLAEAAASSSVCTILSPSSVHEWLVRVVPERLDVQSG